jgi:hypothetical protein
LIIFYQLVRIFQKRIPRRLFTEVFKREAIELVTEQHFNVAEAGRQ